ncbi:glycosyltransferase, partial [Candidatus Moduliflexota bacterium]
MNYSVVIPAFDPDAGMLQIVEAVAATRPEAVVVIDDGSPADKADRFRGLKGLERVVVLRHERNRGKGMAIKTGLRYVLKHNPNA